MPETRQLKGRWWSPGQQEKAKFGVLTLEPGKSPRLEITEERGEGGTDLAPIHSVLHGHDDHRKPVTLLEVGAPSSRSRAAIEEHVYHPLCVVLGVHVETKESFLVNDVAIEVQQLYGWQSRTG